MGKDLNGKELGTGIMQRKDGRYVGRFTNRFGQRQEVKSRDLKQLMQRNVVMGRTTAKPIAGFEEIIFTTKFGTPINTQTYSDAIKSVLENVNLCRDELEKIEYFSPHCFRHTFATRCFEAGIKPKTVQQYLGHATLQMTMDLYTHVLKEHSQEEMIKLEKVLDNTLDDSGATINERFDKFQESDKEKDNIVYLTSVGT